MRVLWLAPVWIALGCPLAVCADSSPGDPELARDVLPLLKTRCVKCHGPAKREGKLNLSTPLSIARGGENGEVVVPREVDSSLLWHRVEADEMPPDDPLPADERAVLQRWIAAGAKRLPTAITAQESGSDHWAFARLIEPTVPEVRNPNGARTNVDRFLLAQLDSQGLAFNPEADRATLIRRVSFDLTGLPPTPQEIKTFLDDSGADAYERMVERFLASPHYGERWGKYWLDAAGYADSNGYFNADSDRPLAYRYRDYVVRALNQDKPFDRFVLEQIAGDELSGFVPGREATREMISLLEATHYLRNGQDGSGESDGNLDEVRTDRYAALESTTQIVASSLLGLTLQCAKCHDHKFESISQRDYYQLQAVFYPAFNIQSWLKPNDRFVIANLPGEAERWEQHSQKITAEIAQLKAGFAAWARSNRPPSTVLFHDEFEDSGPRLAENWSNTAPGDDVAGGAVPVQLDSAQAPGALRQNGVLQILESGMPGDRWISTKQSFDWTPEGEGHWIQLSFDLVDNKVSAGGTPAERIAYFIALHDFNDNSPLPGGNVLIDGNPAGGAAVHVDYPGADSKTAGEFGNGKYERGHNYGLRITNVGDGKFRLDHLVDGVPDDKTLQLKTEDLPDGGFGFEYCCGRSFVVDNVLIERSVAAFNGGDIGQKITDQLQEKRKELAAAVKAKEAERGEQPGKIACVTDRSEKIPDVFLLERGNYATPKEKVQPTPLSALADAPVPFDVKQPFPGAPSTGARLAWARWLTQATSRPAALLARVQINRIWQHHFGAGLVTTVENLGASGAQPSHGELLDYLAGQFIRSGWSMKAMHRLLLKSAAYCQTSSLQPDAFKIDPDNRLLWRHRIERLDAESMRDAMLATSGQLDRHFGGPYVATSRNDLGEVIVNQSGPGANRRSLYLQQRRTQTLSLLNVFDSPTIVFNCVQRPASTMPLQSLSLLNSEFVVRQARRFAERLDREAGAQSEARVAYGFLLALARGPTEAEMRSSLDFIRIQREQYAAKADAELNAWADFCQMMLASNPFLYVE
ncbi:MAG: PSD1 domain-containing protein [Planctomycetia bacterium]|nr:PSD1 domain-containing protein [Planctomycetia bacterium]